MNKWSALRLVITNVLVLFVMTPILRFLEPSASNCRERTIVLGVLLVCTLFLPSSSKKNWRYTAGVFGALGFLAFLAGFLANSVIT